MIGGRKRKSPAAIKAARTRLIKLQGRVGALDTIARTSEALEWSARRCAKLQVAIETATRALKGVRSGGLQSYQPPTKRWR
jgi:hypothetical protein